LLTEGDRLGVLFYGETKEALAVAS
jgi:hypothetical protein